MKVTVEGLMEAISQRVTADRKNGRHELEIERYRDRNRHTHKQGQRQSEWRSQRTRHARQIERKRDIHAEKRRNTPTDR